MNSDQKPSNDAEVENSKPTHADEDQSIHIEAKIRIVDPVTGKVILERRA